MSGQQVCGRLNLWFAHVPAAARTVLHVREQQPPLRVIRAFELEHGAALVHLHNISGGVLGGDRLELAAHIGAQAQVQLTSTGATRLYRSRPEAPPAQQQTTIRVESGGVLDYLPDTLIPFAGSRYRQHTRIELAPDAGLFWWEVVAPGRVGRGERFAYELLEMQTDILAAARYLACERIRLQPQQRPLASSVRLGAYSYYASFYICRVGLDAARWLALETQLQALAVRLSHPATVSWAVSTLPAHGLVIKAVGTNHHTIAAGLVQFWQHARFELYGQVVDPPRKVS